MPSVAETAAAAASPAIGSPAVAVSSPSPVARPAVSAAAVAVTPPVQVASDSAAVTAASAVAAAAPSPVTAAAVTPATAPGSRLHLQKAQAQEASAVSKPTAATGASAPGEGLKMGKWGLSDTIANDESFLSFGQLSFGVPDVGGPESQSQQTSTSVGTSAGNGWGATSGSAMGWGTKDTATSPVETAGTKPPGFSSTVTASPSVPVGAGPPPGLPPLGNVKQVHELEAEMDSLNNKPHSQFSQVSKAQSKLPAAQQPQPQPQPQQSQQQQPVQQVRVV
ncbi:unnamed protein product [Ectocarpus sp. 12 AP-2014]